MSNIIIPFTDIQGRTFPLRSNLERIMARRIDRAQNIAFWDYESIEVPVPKRLQRRLDSRYFLPDFYVQFDCGEEWVYEGKGLPWMQDYLDRKHQLIDEFCWEQNIFYQVVYDHPFESQYFDLELYCQSNIRFWPISDWEPMPLREWTRRGIIL